MQGDLSNFPYTLISHSHNLKRFDAYWFFVGVNTNLFVVPTLPDVWRYTSFFSNKIIRAVEYCYRHKSAHRNLTLKSTVSWMNIKDSCITPYFYFYSLLSITIATVITTDGNFLKTRQRLFQESYTLGPERCLDLWSYPAMLYVMLYDRLPLWWIHSICFLFKD